MPNTATNATQSGDGRGLRSLRINSEDSRNPRRATFRPPGLATFKSQLGFSGAAPFPPRKPRGARSITFGLFRQAPDTLWLTHSWPDGAPTSRWRRGAVSRNRLGFCLRGFLGGLQTVVLSPAGFAFLNVVGANRHRPNQSGLGTKANRILEFGVRRTGPAICRREETRDRASGTEGRTEVARCSPGVTTLAIGTLWRPARSPPSAWAVVPQWRSGQGL